MRSWGLFGLIIIRDRGPLRSLGLLLNFLDLRGRAVPSVALVGLVARRTVIMIQTDLSLKIKKRIRIEMFHFMTRINLRPYIT